MSRFIQLTMARFHTQVCVNVADVVSYSVPVPGTPAAADDVKTLLILRTDDVLGVTEEFKDVDRMIRLSVN